MNTPDNQSLFPPSKSASPSKDAKNSAKIAFQQQKKKNTDI